MEILKKRIAVLDSIVHRSMHETWLKCFISMKSHGDLCDDNDIIFHVHTFVDN